ncbi:MAG: winged helix-turn-helix transcriptional regulator [Bdellovibrionaceae bacterium]|nr:winged helix-turn-helix transcriptional regulator [Pseudobdellovibrionaceae bacterium]
MRGLHENQRKILDYLLDHPEGATLDELASHLGITKTAAKEHLIKVENLGYLKFVDSKGGVGRPRRRYLLSQDAHDAFPKQYSWLSNVLLELLADDLGQDRVARIMKDLADKVAGSMADKFKGAKSHVELLSQVTKTLNDLGYRASLKQSDLRKGAVIEATNCVYHTVAKEHPELCGFDIRFIENASGMDVKLETCIARGGSVCRFCLKKKGS